ncbi:MAG: homoserine kinase [Actinomycetota bacterium]|jgi:homoserine kinase|nr:homoserine kinase [Actinomycetota bacterium]
MTFRAIVPATSANLGPGFDCFGLALELCNEVILDVEAVPGVTFEGEGATELPTDGSDMISRSFGHVARAAGVPPPAFALHGVNRIPLERGLGSSAAATVAGILLADSVLHLGFGSDDVLDLAIELEGHPDNAAAAIVGGFTLAFGDGVLRLDAAPELRPVALIPEVTLPTAEARAALPQMVRLADAVYNASHAAAAVVAITSQPAMLPDVLGDRLHQDARLALIPSVKTVFDELRAADIPVCVSGAGPTLLAFDLPGLDVPDPGEGWHVMRLPVRTSGAQVEEED